MSFYNTNTNSSPSFHQQQQLSGHLLSTMKRNNTFKSKLKSLKNELHEAIILTATTTKPLLPWSRPPTRSNSTSSFRSPFSSIKLSNGNTTGQSSVFSSCESSPRSISLSSTKNDSTVGTTDVFPVSRSTSVSLPISKFKSPTTIISTVTNSATSTTTTCSPCSISYSSLDYDYDYDNLFDLNSPTSSYDPSLKNERLANKKEGLGQEEKFLLPPLPSSTTTLTPVLSSSPGKFSHDQMMINGQVDAEEMEKQEFSLLLPTTPSNNSQKYQNSSFSQQLLSHENNQHQQNNNPKSEELVDVDRLACSILSLVGKRTNDQNIEWNI